MQRIVLIPRSVKLENLPLMFGIPVIAIFILLGTFWAIDYVPMRNLNRTFALPDNFFTIFLIMTLFITLLFAFVALISFNHELIWAHDPAKGEIRLEDWYYGTPVFSRRYPLKDVAGIRIWWQQSYLGGAPVTSNPGWWMAALVLWSGKSIHLHGERGGPRHPPVEWLERFEHACRVSGLELKREPVPPRDQNPIAKIINRQRRGQ